MDYKNKYLKYKFKYLQLKKGGSYIFTDLNKNDNNDKDDNNKDDNNKDDNNKEHFLTDIIDDDIIDEDAKNNFLTDILDVDDDIDFDLSDLLDESGINLKRRDLTCCSFYNPTDCKNTVPIIPKLICNEEIGFNNIFSTCWLLSILYIFFFSDSTSNCVQYIIYHAENIINTESNNFLLLLEYFPDLAMNSKLDIFIKSIKSRFNNKVYEKMNPIKIKTENIITDWLNQESPEDPRLRPWRREISANIELNLEIEISDLFNLQDRVQHGLLYKNKSQYDNIPLPNYGADAPFSFCVSNILSCLLLNKLTRLFRCA
jgi:hypothetical protein